MDILYKIPDSWVWTTLEQIADMTSGGTPSRTKKEYWNGNINWLKSGELKDTYIHEVEEKITEDGLKGSSAKIFPKDTLLMAMYGATVGRLGILNVDSSTNQAVCAIFNHHKLFVNEYLFFYLLSMRQKMLKDSFGGAQPNLSQGYIKSIDIPFAPLNEQKRIVAKIEKLFSNLDNSDKYLLHLEKQLKKYRQSVLKSAFEGELTKEWRKKNKNIQDVQKLIDNIQIEKEELIRKKKINRQKTSYEIENNLILKSIPFSWVYCKLGKITNVVRGGSPRPAGDERFYNGNIPFLKVADLTKNDSMYVDGYTYSIKETGLKKTRYVEEEVLLLSNSGATLGVPKICTFPTAFNDGIAAFIHMNKYLSKSFFYYFLKSKTKWFLFEASQGQGQPNLNTDIISETIISLPSYEEQNEIVKQIEKHFSIIDKLEVVVQQSIKESKRLRQSILKQAFEGKLVEQDPNDESASVLLEKIAKAKEEYQKAMKRKK